MFEINSNHFRAANAEPWEQVGRTDYRLEIDNGKKIIHVTGRPSSQRADWKDNLDFRIRSKTQKWFRGIRVHAGFLRQYLAVRGKLLDVCYEHPGYAIRVDGFSLGGSWTQIFVQDVLHRWPDRDIQAIFYAPGNPWRRLPRKYRGLLRRRVTFVIPWWDAVTWMRLIGFKRYGKDIRIGRIWRLWPKQHHPDQIIRALDERFPLKEEQCVRAD